VIQYAGRQAITHLLRALLVHFNAILDLVDNVEDLLFSFVGEEEQILDQSNLLCAVGSGWLCSFIGSLLGCLLWIELRSASKADTAMSGLAVLASLLCQQRICNELA